MTKVEKELTGLWKVVEEFRREFDRIEDRLRKLENHNIED